MGETKKNTAKPSVLQRENNGTDLLTGLMNATELENKIMEKLEKYETGSLILVDIDHLNAINIAHGHLCGDRVLLEVADVLKKNFFSTDIVGRYGGDEFIVFSPSNISSQFIMNKGKGVINYIKEFGKQEKISRKLTLTIGVVSAVKTDTFQELMQQAESILCYGKKRGGGMVSMAVDDVALEEISGIKNEDQDESSAINRDVELIWQDLREKTDASGAYCQDYENFACIYRFVERGLWRTEQSVYAILLTLMDHSHRFLSVEEQARTMQRLSKIIGASLRIGDIYTQYSSCQFLIMVLDASYENALSIVDRIRNNLRRSALEDEVTMIDCAIHPLEPAAKAE